MQNAFETASIFVILQVNNKTSLYYKVNLNIEIFLLTNKRISAKIA